jgi:hypothetical protein
MKPVFALLLCSLVTAAPAFAGEDSTDRWGDGGTGPTIWESPCSLAEFQGNVPMPEKCRPVQERRHRDQAAQATLSAPTAPAPASATVSPESRASSSEPRQ